MKITLIIQRLLLHNVTIYSNTRIQDKQVQRKYENIRIS